MKTAMIVFVALVDACVVYGAAWIWWQIFGEAVTGWRRRRAWRRKLRRTKSPSDLFSRMDR